VTDADDYTWRKASRSVQNGNCVEIGWRTSSRSAGNGQCVEVGAPWHKSSRSSDSANCVEVAELPAVVLVRDTKNRDGGTLRFDEAAWRGFVADVREGRYDL
jgi:hypothetical protein